MVGYRSKFFALFGICILAFTAFLDFTIVNTALPYIQKALNINIIQLQWVANILPIILCMTMVAIGKFADLLGRRKLFYFGGVFFAVACLCAGLSPNVEILIFFRGLQGLCIAIIFVTSLSLISETFHGEEKIQAIGIYGAVTGAGLMIGPFFGGILIALLSWRWVFWINLPLIFTGLASCWFSLTGKSPTHPEIKIDWKGICLLIVGLGSLTYGIVELKIWLIAIGAIALAILIYTDLKAPVALLYLDVFKDKLVLLSILSCMLAGGVSFVFMFFDPLFLEGVRNLSAFHVGLMIAIIPAGQVLTSVAFQKLVKRVGLANLLFISCLCGALSVFFHLFLGPHISIYYAILPFFLIGINWGLSNTATMTAINQNMATQKIGEAIGTIATIWNTIGAIFLALSAVIFHAFGGDFMGAFRSVIAFNLAFMLIVVLAAIWIRKRLPAS
jgi:MFS family permease